jgi:uncharacterized protein YukE
MEAWETVHGELRTSSAATAHVFMTAGHEESEEVSKKLASHVTKYSSQYADLIDQVKKRRKRVKEEDGVSGTIQFKENEVPDAPVQIEEE